MFNNILFICVGNICRSPTAEFLLKHKLADKAGNYHVHSAGLNAVVGHDIDESAKALLDENGIPYAPHQGRKVSSSLLREADLILAMEPGHLTELHKRYPEQSGKCFLLGKWLGDSAINDPHRKSAEVFTYVYKQIDASLDEWVKRL